MRCSTRVWEGVLLTARFLEKQILLPRLRDQDDMVAGFFALLNPGNPCNLWINGLYDDGL